jgi:hypothetical protein
VQVPQVPQALQVLQVLQVLLSLLSRLQVSPAAVIDCSQSTKKLQKTLKLQITPRISSYSLTSLFTDKTFLLKGKSIKWEKVRVKEKNRLEDKGLRASLEAKMGNEGLNYAVKWLIRGR